MNGWLRRSLAGRLAAAFAFVTAIVFGIAGVHLYHFLNEQLRRQEDLALLGTMEILRNQLAKRDGMEAIHAVVNLLHAAYGPDAVVLAIRDGAGHLIAAAGPDAERLAAADAVPLDQAPDVNDIRDWPGNDGSGGRVLAAWQYANDATTDTVLLTIARNASASGVVLNAHGQEVLVTLGLGVVAAGLLGYLAARRAVRPVRRLAETAGRITASALDERLHADEAPRELGDMIHAFNRMLDRLQESFGRLSRFSADLAHDLQTPLNNLMGETQVALSQRRTVADYEALLASNVEEYERLSRMIRDMLFLARADHPETVITASPVDLRQELDKVADYFRALGDDGDVSITVRGAGTVAGDALLIRRAIQNLLSNAVRYGDGGPIVADISNATPGYVDIAVGNTGPGIAREHLPHIFDRFYRPDSARTRSAEGSGLGLAIVKSIATLHGGEVTVSSTPGERTTFVLRLPGDAGPATTAT